jgi:hypothetical protein
MSSILLALNGKTNAGSSAKSALRERARPAGPQNSNIQATGRNKLTDSVKRSRGPGAVLHEFLNIGPGEMILDGRAFGESIFSFFPPLRSRANDPHGNGRRL